MQQDFIVATCPSEIEIFYPIKGYEGLYEISNFGNVKSFRRKSSGKLMKTKSDKDGYLYLGLRYDVYPFIRKWYRINRLVLQAFELNIDKFSQTNHRDCNVKNNHISNLEWCDVTYNNRYRYLKGWRNPVGSNSSASKINEEIAYEIIMYDLTTDFTEPMIATIIGVSKKIVSSVRLCKTWRHVSEGSLWQR